MGKYLHLDSVVGGHPVAEAELAALRAALANERERIAAALDAKADAHRAEFDAMFASTTAEGRDERFWNAVKRMDRAATDYSFAAAAVRAMPPVEG